MVMVPSQEKAPIPATGRGGGVYEQLKCSASEEVLMLFPSGFSRASARVASRWAAQVSFTTCLMATFQLNVYYQVVDNLLT